MDKKHLIITTVYCSWILLATIHCDVIYFSLSSGRGCPINQRCLVLSQTVPESIYGNQSNTTLLFLPGNHTLIFNLIFEHLSYLWLKSSTPLALPKPVINCIQLSKFQFNSINSVIIENLKFSGCLHNGVSTVHRFALQDCTLIGSNKPPGGAITITASNVHAIRNSFPLFSSFNYRDDGILHLSSSSISMMDCIFVNNQIRALYTTKSIDITVANSNFTHHTAACVENCIGGIMYFEFSSALNIVSCTFANN